MKPIIILTAALLCVFSAPTFAKPLKVFILAGQSNMQGHVNVSTFDARKAAESVQPKHTWNWHIAYNLGATGMRGWIYIKAANNLDAAQGRTTFAIRQGSSPAPQHHVSIQTMSPNKL